jgi:hypothetical protein
MTDKHPGERPGHLDIDAVSAFVDRDFGPDELTALEFHLHQCPACHREVLEIRATVLLLAALPQYAPRRSFCLDHGHARRARHASVPPSPVPGGPVWPAAPGMAGAAVGVGRYGAWLPGLQTVAVAVGVLLLLVTMGDMLGLPETTGQQFAVSTAVAATASSMDNAVPPAAPLPEEPAFFRQAAESDPDAEGTNALDSASEEISTDGASAPGPEASAAALLTPAAAVGRESAPTDQTAGGAGSGTSGASRPALLQWVKVGLAVLLAWLVVTIIGLRRVRAL